MLAKVCVEKSKMGGKSFFSFGLCWQCSSIPTATFLENVAINPRNVAKTIHIVAFSKT